MFTIEMPHPVDALIMGYALDEAIKRYDDSIEYWSSPERTMSPEGKRTVIATITDDKDRLIHMKRSLENQLTAYRRRNGVTHA